MHNIEERYSNIEAMRNLAMKCGEVSLGVAVSDVGTKDLLISMGSYFEHEVTDSIKRFYLRALKTESPIEFINKAALARKFYTLFDFKTNNANSFFGHFGEDFKKHMKSTIEADDKLKKAIEDFMYICSSRNKLVHGNYSEFNLDDTSEELLSKFKSADSFVTQIETLLTEYHIT